MSAGVVGLQRDGVAQGGDRLGDLADVLLNDAQVIEGVDVVGGQGDGAQAAVQRLVQPSQHPEHFAKVAQPADDTVAADRHGAPDGGDGFGAPVLVPVDQAAEIEGARIVRMARQPLIGDGAGVVVSPGLQMVEAPLQHQSIV